MSSRIVVSSFSRHPGGVTLIGIDEQGKRHHYDLEAAYAQAFVSAMLEQIRESKKEARRDRDRAPKKRTTRRYR